MGYRRPAPSLHACYALRITFTSSSHHLRIKSTSSPRIIPISYYVKADILPTSYLHTSIHFPFYPAHARQQTLSFTSEEAFSTACPQASIVAPVVSTSSINNTCPSGLSPRQAYPAATFSQRSTRERFVCDPAASFVRTSPLMSWGIPSISEIPSAIASAWL